MSNRLQSVPANDKHSKLDTDEPITCVNEIETDYGASSTERLPPLSFTVRARTREIGIRMALGFEPSRVFRMLLWESWSIALPGVVIGLALSLAVGRTIQGFLFGIVPYDPATLITVVIVMAGVSTFVGFLPARRAARVNPIETLRYE